MAFRIVADKVEDLPEGLRAAAKVVDGKVQVEALPEGWGLEDFQALKASVATEREAVRELKRKIKDFEGLEDPAAAREALEAMQAGRLKSSKEVDEWKKAAEAKYASDAAKVRAQTEGLTKQLRALLVDHAAMQAIVEAKGNPKLLMPIVRSAAKAELADDGTLSVRLVGEDGKELMTRASGSTAPMQFSEFVSTLRDNPDFKSAFEGSGTGGSGASGTRGGSGRAVNPGDLTAGKLFERARLNSTS